MKAWVLHGIEDIRFEDVSRPDPADNEVLVKVEAAGICGSDIPRVYRTGAHVHPLVPGHEFSGKVVQTGKRVNKKWMDQRVGIFPLIPCKSCGECEKQHYELCRSYGYLGSRKDGGFAEYVAVPEWNLIELPAHVTYEQAAMLEPMAVAAHAVRRVLLSGCDRTASIAVCGLGTIGQLLVMLLIEAGYENIYAVGNKKSQGDMVVKAGISRTHFYDNKNGGHQEWLMEQTSGEGIKVFFECVGKNETVSAAISCAAPNGTVQLVGNPDSNILLEKNIYWKILRNQLTVKGSWNSSFRHSSSDDWNYVLERLRRNRLSPEHCITHYFALDELNQGLFIMRNKTEEYVKIMVR